MAADPQTSIKPGSGCAGDPNLACDSASWALAAGFLESKTQAQESRNIIFQDFEFRGTVVELYQDSAGIMYALHEVSLHRISRNSMKGCQVSNSEVQNRKQVA